MGLVAGVLRADRVRGAGPEGQLRGRRGPGPARGAATCREASHRVGHRHQLGRLREAPLPRIPQRAERHPRGAPRAGGGGRRQPPPAA